MLYHLRIARLILTGVCLALAIVLLWPLSRWKIPHKLHDAVLPILTRWSRQLVQMESERKIKKWSKQ